jgi:hypothetical protein
MRGEHAKHARAARNETAAQLQGARGLCPRAFTAKAAYLGKLRGV